MPEKFAFDFIFVKPQLTTLSRKDQIIREPIIDNRTTCRSDTQLIIRLVMETRNLSARL